MNTSLQSNAVESPVGQVRFELQIPPLRYDDWRRGQSLVARSGLKAIRTRSLVIALIMGIIAGGIFVIASVGSDIEVAFLIKAFEDEYGWEGVSALVAILVIFDLGVVCTAVLTWDRQRRFAQWFYARTQILNTEHNLVIGDKGIAFRAPFRSCFYAWDTITALHEVKGCWFLVIDTTSFFWIPERCITDTHLLRAYLQQHIQLGGRQ